MPTYLMEAFWPGVTPAAHAAAAARAEAATAILRDRGRDITYLGSELLPDDEVVFFRFAATAVGDVEAAGALADLTFERVVAYVERPGPAEGP